jgi:hypothetical protein
MSIMKLWIQRIFGGFGDDSKDRSIRDECRKLASIF